MYSDVMEAIEEWVALEKTGQQIYRILKEEDDFSLGEILKGLADAGFEVTCKQVGGKGPVQAYVSDRQIQQTVSEEVVVENAEQEDVLASLVTH